MNSDYQIISTSPTDRKQLQLYVSMILMDCGFRTQIEKVVETVRGKVEIDVYAENNEAFETKVLCECKHWSVAVPQTIVHAFRTIVNDSGASQGFIISKLGFQKGAYEATGKSNIAILSWHEFQESFKIEWLKKIINRNSTIGKRLMKVSTDIISGIHKGTLELNEKELSEFYEKKESDILFLTFREH